MTHENTPDIVDRAANLVAADTADPATVAAAASRVRAAIGSTSDFAGCAEFQAGIPAFLSGELTGARRELLADHVGSCIPCRKALKAAKGEAPAAPVRAPRTFDSGRYALAAILIVALAIGALLLGWGGLSAGGDGEIELVEADGLVFALENGALARWTPGVTKAGVPVRTGKGSHAVVQLADGSRIELAERTELAVRSGGDGDVIDLSRGNIVVAAAKQHGHLAVSTGDCLVTVTGTVFSVASGIKGSRVSVFEGEVHVDGGKGVNVLLPGDQVTTNERIERVPLEVEVAWSKQRDRWLELAREMKAARKEIQSAFAAPTWRDSSTLLDLAPAGTVVWAGLPNISGDVAQAYSVIESKVAQNPILAEWWSEGGNGDKANEVIDEIATIGSYIGDEVAFAISKGDAGGPLAMASVGDAAALRAHVAQLLATATADNKLRLISEPATAMAEEGAVYLWIGDTLAAVSSSLPQLQATANVASGAVGSGFVGTPFHSELVATYGRSVSWIFAADIENIVAEKIASGGNAAALEASGAADAKYVIVERRDVGGVVSDRATVSFKRPRRGVASWLAAPAPMGSLDFVSPDAALVTTAVIKEPAQAIDDLFAILGASTPTFTDSLAELETKLGVKVRDDLAAPLGGEILVALDGPALPKPAWKVILEIYDPARLQMSLEALVAKADQSLKEEGKPGLTIDSQANGGRTYWRIHTPDSEAGLHYVFVDGWMIASAERTWLEDAIRYRDTGANLPSSPAFTSLLPTDGMVDFSAIGYQNLAPAIASVAKNVADNTDIDPKLKEMAATFSEDAAASLVYAYAADDRIVFAHDGGFAALGFDVATYLGLSNVIGAGAH